MVSPEQLEALDLTLWLGTERLAAHRLCCNQSTVCRRSQEVQRRFKVERVRDDLSLSWELTPDSPLLAMERQVHQLHRWLEGGGLRLEADPWLAPLMQALPPGWIHGTLDILGVDRPLALLRSRVIDAWLSCSTLDLPPADDPDLLVIELARLPLLLVAHPRHPLVGRDGLTSHDLARFPSLAMADHHYPRFAAATRRRGLWRAPVALQRYEVASWEGLTADQATLGYANALSLLSHARPGQPRLQPLKVPTHLDANVALVLSRDLAALQPVQELGQQLQACLRELLAGDPQLELVA